MPLLSAPGPALPAGTMLVAALQPRSPESAHSGPLPGTACVTGVSGDRPEVRLNAVLLRIPYGLMRVPALPAGERGPACRVRRPVEH